MSVAKGGKQGRKGGEKKTAPRKDGRGSRIRPVLVDCTCRQVGISPVETFR